MALNFGDDDDWSPSPAKRPVGTARPGLRRPGRSRGAEWGATVGACCASAAPAADLRHERGLRGAPRPTRRRARRPAPALLVAAAVAAAALEPLQSLPVAIFLSRRHLSVASAPRLTRNIRSHQSASSRHAATGGRRSVLAAVGRPDQRFGFALADGPSASSSVSVPTSTRRPSSNHGHK